MLLVLWSFQRYWLKAAEKKNILSFFGSLLDLTDALVFHWAANNTIPVLCQTHRILYFLCTNVVFRASGMSRPLSSALSIFSDASSTSFWAGIPNILLSQSFLSLYAFHGCLVKHMIFSCDGMLFIPILFHRSVHRETTS